MGELDSDFDLCEAFCSQGKVEFGGGEFFLI